MEESDQDNASETSNTGTEVVDGTAVNIKTSSAVGDEPEGAILVVRNNVIGEQVTHA
jgi:hypothetical protein